jgi:hypothetical protein
LMLMLIALYTVYSRLLGTSMLAPQVVLIGASYYLHTKQLIAPKETTDDLTRRLRS